MGQITFFLIFCLQKMMYDIMIKECKNMSCSMSTLLKIFFNKNLPYITIYRLKIDFHREVPIVNNYFKFLS